MLRLLLHWVLSAVSFILLAKFLPGFHVRSFGTAMLVAAVYGILHVLLYNILVVVAFIPVFLTFGLFTFVIDAFLLFLADKLIEDFRSRSWRRPPCLRDSAGAAHLKVAIGELPRHA